MLSTCYLYIIQTSVVVEFGGKQKPTYIPPLHIYTDKNTASIMYGRDVYLEGTKFSKKTERWNIFNFCSHASMKRHLHQWISFGSKDVFCVIHKFYSQLAEKLILQKMSLNSFVCGNALVMKYLNDVYTFWLEFIHVTIYTNVLWTFLFNFLEYAVQSIGIDWIFQTCHTYKGIGHVQSFLWIHKMRKCGKNGEKANIFRNETCIQRIDSTY